MPVGTPAQAGAGHQNGLVTDTSLVAQYGLALSTELALGTSTGWHWAVLWAHTGHQFGQELGTGWYWVPARTGALPSSPGAATAGWDLLRGTFLGGKQSTGTPPAVLPPSPGRAAGCS